MRGYFALTQRWTALCLVCVCNVCAVAAEKQQPPNVVFIVADDMGYGDFGCFNGGLSETPRLDALATEGVCLTQHYSGSPVCASTSGSLRS